MAGISLGDLVAGGLADPVVQPATQVLPTPAPPPTKVSAPVPQKVAPPPVRQAAGLPTQKPVVDPKTKSLWRQALEDPRTKAGFIQLGVNLLAGQGLGEAIGGGAAAIGRVEDGRIEAEEIARRADLEERRVRVAEAAGARAGRGGGRRGRGGATGSRTRAANDKLVARYLKFVEGVESAAADSTPLGEAYSGLTPGQKLQAAEMLAIADANGGDPGALLDALLLDFEDTRLKFQVMQGTAPMPVAASNPADGPGGKRLSPELAADLQDGADLQDVNATSLPGVPPVSRITLDAQGNAVHSGPGYVARRDPSVPPPPPIPQGLTLQDFPEGSPEAAILKYLLNPDGN